MHLIQDHHLETSQSSHATDSKLLQKDTGCFEDNLRPAPDNTQSLRANALKSTSKSSLQRLINLPGINPGPT